MKVAKYLAPPKDASMGPQISNVGFQGLLPKPDGACPFGFGPVLRARSAALCIVILHKEIVVSICLSIPPLSDFNRL